MLRTLCMIIAFLVAAKEVVAFEGNAQSSQSKTYSALDLQSHDVWLCESEGGAERDECDDSNESFDFPTDCISDFAILGYLAPCESNQYSFLTQCVALQLFITYRNLRL